MRQIVILTLLVPFVFLVNCRPAAAPISVGNRPVSINDVPSGEAPSQPRRPISEMSWTDFNGGVSKMKDFAGRAVILDLWATYCPPCIDEIPHLMALKAKYGDRLDVVGLHVGGDEDRPKIPEFAKKLKISYELAYPEDDLTSFISGGDSRIPQTAVFDREGRLVDKFVGFDPDVKSSLDSAVDRAVGQ